MVYMNFLEKIRDDDENDGFRMVVPFNAHCTT